jgi:hypothetical protein
MWGISASFLARTLAVFALISQALMPGAMAAAMSRPGDAMSVLCAMPSAQPADGAQEVGAELSGLIASKSGGKSPGMDHDCHDCVLGQVATLPAVASVGAPFVFAPVAEDAPRFEVRYWTPPRGPPLGSRAPPVLMKA